MQQSSATSARVAQSLRSTDEDLQCVCWVGGSGEHPVLPPLPSASGRQINLSIVYFSRLLASNRCLIFLCAFPFPFIFTLFSSTFLFYFLLIRGLRCLLSMPRMSYCCKLIWLDALCFMYPWFMRWLLIIHNFVEQRWKYIQVLIVIHSQFSLSPLEFGHVPAESLIYLCTGSFSFVNYMWSPCGRLQFEGFALSLSLYYIYIELLCSPFQLRLMSWEMVSHFLKAYMFFLEGSHSLVCLGLQASFQH